MNTARLPYNASVRSQPPLAPPMTPRLTVLLLSAFVLAGCDMVQHRLGLQDPAKLEAIADGEGRAVGAGCRQSGRAIEDCYALYDRLPKASIFAGWRDMNDYMIANQLETVAPRLNTADATARK
jgi:hypothetical protein